MKGEFLIQLCAVVVTIGTPVGLWILSEFRGDIRRLHERIDEHICNYEIHTKGAK